MKSAVLLLAYGGPDSLDDVPAYLLNIRGGRETPQALIDEISERYRLIGGRSPLLTITRSIAARLSEAVGLPVYVGMRHWRPFIGDVVARMANDGVDRVIAICMAPHYSRLSIGAYRARLEEAIAAVDRSMALDFVESWHTQPDYLAGVAANVRATLTRFPAGERGQVMVVFTAHSLPTFIIERGDPYDSQLRETAQLVSRHLTLPGDRWLFCYQSAPPTSRMGASSLEAVQGPPESGQWLGPQVEELVVELAQAGDRSLLVAPIGFVTDHMETLYDIDISLQRLARAYDVHLERTPMLNDTPPLIAALSGLVRNRLGIIGPAASSHGRRVERERSAQREKAQQVGVQGNGRECEGE